jgi:hypothetical protein
MFNSQEYWRAVLLQQAEIEKNHTGGSVWITSLSDPARGQVGGAVCDTSLRLGTDRYGVAAKAIVDRTHRLATPAEIEQFHEEQKRRDAALSVETSRLNRGGNGYLFVDQAKLVALGEP